MSRRVEAWIIVPCPVCKVPEGVKCSRSGAQHIERIRDGSMLHRIWEAAGAETYYE